MMPSLSVPLAGFGVVVLFTGVWFWLAGHLTAWSDEIAHMSAAKGILLTGEPFSVVFDRCAQLTTGQYLRGLEISRWTAWSYDLFGESLAAARAVPFVFTIATWLLYVVYTRWRGYSSGKQILVATVLFFGQTMVLEKALYVRVYAPLLFFLLLSLIAAWEAVNSWRAKKFPLAMAWLGVIVLSLGLTRGWHLLQFAIFGLAITFLWLLICRLPIRDLLRRAWRQLVSLPVRWKYPAFTVLVLFVAGSITIGPRVVDVLGSEILGFQVGFSFGRKYLTPVQVVPWDNIAGLLRFLLVTNVLLFVWWRTSRADEPEDDFNSWVLSTGIISGLLVAFLMNHNFVFWSRFFYLSVGLIALGVSTKVANLPSTYAICAALGVYLLINGLISGSTFYLDRSNIKRPINWLTANTSESDLVLAFDAELSLHGGESLCNRTATIRIVQTGDTADVSKQGESLHYIRRVAGYPFITGDELKDILSKKPSSDVYFLYSDHYKLRNNLYRWTTGTSRGLRNDLFGLLKDGDVGEQVISGLRSSGLRRLDRGKLLAALELRNFP